MKTHHVTITVTIPPVPDMLAIGNGQSIPLNAVTDEGLRQIGAEWTEALIAKAHGKATDTPGNTDAAQPAAPAGEWPKWTDYSGCVRVFVSQNAAYALDCFGQWKSSVVSDYRGYECNQITRAKAVELIGEAAVAEGERLAGGAK
jgi:hypothetical protein